MSYNGQPKREKHFHFCNSLAEPRSGWTGTGSRVRSSVDPNLQKGPGAQMEGLRSEWKPKSRALHWTESNWRYWQLHLGVLRWDKLQRCIFLRQNLLFSKNHSNTNLQDLITLLTAVDTIFLDNMPIWSFVHPCLWKQKIQDRSNGTHQTGPRTCTSRIWRWVRVQNQFSLHLNTVYSVKIGNLPWQTDYCPIFISTKF